MEIVCPKCNATYRIPDNKVPIRRFSKKCDNCDFKIIIDPTKNIASRDRNLLSPSIANASVPATIEKTAKFKEYKVIYIVEGGCGTIILGASGIPIKKMEVTLNEEAANGWQVVFQVVEQKRFLLFWKREAIIVTLGR